MVKIAKTHPPYETHKVEADIDHSLSLGQIHDNESRAHGWPNVGPKPYLDPNRTPGAVHRMPAMRFNMPELVPTEDTTEGFGRTEIDIPLRRAPRWPYGGKDKMGELGAL